MFSKLLKRIGGQLPEQDCRDFPTQVEAPSGRTLDVSAGGLVRVNCDEDIFVLQKPGVTVVERVRTLDDSFYVASADADDAFIQQCEAVIGHFAECLDMGAEFKCAPYQNPLIKQLANDLNRYHGVCEQLRRDIGKASLSQRELNLIGSDSVAYSTIRDGVSAPIEEGLHVDSSFMTALFYYVGKTSYMLDERVSDKEFRGLVASQKNPNPSANQTLSKRLLDRYNTASFGLGNIVFFKGMASIGDLMSPQSPALSAAEISEGVSNLCLHSAPEADPDDLRALALTR